MSEQEVINSNQKNIQDRVKELVITELQQEIEIIPREYWDNLLEIVRLFRKSVSLNSDLPMIANKENPLKIPKAELLNKQHQALSQLTKEWLEEGDEQEQSETLEYLRQALNENRIDQRTLFP